MEEYCVWFAPAKVKRSIPAVNIFLCRSETVLPLENIAQVKWYAPGQIVAYIYMMQESYVINGIIMTDEPTTPEMMLQKKISLLPWWVVLLWGVLALFIGIMFLTTPAITTILVITLLGAFWFVGGIFTLASAAVDKSQRAWKIFLGILNIIVGLIILAYPLYSTLILLMFFIIFVGFWACIMGFMHLYQAFAAKDAGTGLLGIVSIIFGILLLVFPIYSAVLLPFVAGIFALVAGFAAIIVSFTVKKAAAAPAP